MNLPPAIQKLITAFTTLPTVGQKTAERYVFYLLKQPKENLQAMAAALLELKDKTTLCQNCFAVAEQSPCPTCADARRDASLLCIVADSRDMIALEATKQYSGYYHILNALINAIEESRPEAINLQTLVNKIKTNPIKEIILALDPNLEGETTAMYLTNLIKQNNPAIKITRLAKGLPMGANIEYADEMTMSNALKYRTESL